MELLIKARVRQVSQLLKSLIEDTECHLPCHCAPAWTWYWIIFHKVITCC